MQPRVVLQTQTCEGPAARPCDPRRQPGTAYCVEVSTKETPMARPAAPPGRKKSIRLSARFNQAEARIVAERAKADGMTVSDELRRAVGLPPRRKDPEQQQIITI